MTSHEFNEILWDFYAKNSRDTLPWRKPEPDGSYDPYKIMVSEIMLQQTQVSRVIPKYQEWLATYPSAKSLANAPLSDVLGHWIGLGYNRRAKYLHESAKQVSAVGGFPRNKTDLIKLHGVGANTAGAILAYAYNEPTVFIETNIRTVFLYHYFPNEEQVADSQLLPLIEQVLDKENPREWYWALMDYGSYLKQSEGNYSKNSKHHVKQSKFEGSRRQVRGKVLTELIANKQQSKTELAKKINDDRLADVLNDLLREGLIAEKQDRFSLAT